jgi:universal stress protein A
MADLFFALLEKQRALFSKLRKTHRLALGKRAFHRAWNLRVSQNIRVVQEVYMDKVRKILAPTDFSDLSKVGVRYALEMARDTCAEVVVYHVIDFGEYWTNNPRNIPQYGNIFEDSRRLLDRFLAEHFADCIDLVEVRQVVEIGTPYKNIVDKAATDAVDMIVISTHGRTGIDHLILGSVAEKVVARAPCPVLVIPRQEREATTARAA